MKPVLDHARSGRGDAFAELTEPYRRELHLHCYRMLGSVSDADDLLQETLLAAWRGLATFEARSSVRTWLYTIATTRCLNAIRDGRRRPPVAPSPPFDAPTPSRYAEITWLEPYPQSGLDELVDPAAAGLRRETVELAFIIALQRIPPRQTAALVLKDVLAFDTGEVAAMLGTSPTAVKGMLQRARAALGRSSRSGPNPPTADVPLVERQRAQRFSEALIAGNVHALIGLLTDDAWLAMPPAPHEYHGRAAIAEFLRARALWVRPREIRLDYTESNAQPGFRSYLVSSARVEYTGVMVLTMSGPRVRAITHFLEPPPLAPAAVTAARTSRSAPPW